MAILTQRVTWRRQATKGARVAWLTPTERANVKAVMRALAKRHGWNHVAAALGVPRKTVENAMRPGTAGPSAGMAIRIARLAGVSAEDVISGAFRRAGACLVCGRGD